MSGRPTLGRSEPGHGTAGPRTDMIEVDQVSKFWGTQAALRSASFTVQRGALTVLLGPSGCGKSTTLRLIAGLERADAGRILIGGRNVTHEPPSLRDISMVFQSYALFPHLSVAENIVFGLRVRKVDGAERRRRLDDVAELLALGPLLDRKPSQISGGQQQRVALGRAIVARKPVCLMDEPLSNLDAQLRADMRKEIRALQQKLGITMVYVTHDQTEAMTMADQVILIRNGEIEQDATPTEIYARPASTFVAGFVGAPPMNVIERGRVPSSIVGQLFNGAADTTALGIRPEDVHLTGTQGLPVRVDAVEFLGADSLITCSMGETSILCRLQGRAPVGVGTQTCISWSSESLHHFEGTTGRRVGQQTDIRGGSNEQGRTRS